LAHFDSAAPLVAGDPALPEAVTIGRARALLDSGDWTAAAAATTSVPSGFADSIPYNASGGPQNTLALAFAGSSISVADDKGLSGLPFVSAHDPRIVSAGSGMTSAGDSEYVLPAYSNAGTAIQAPIPFATVFEAQLIRAEALLPVHGGAGTAWLDTLNAMRATVALPPLADPGNDSARVSLLFSERAFWLFATGHRHGDLRRLVRQYGRDPNAIFPHGLFQHGPKSYGTMVMFTPYGEESNPNFHGCLDLNL
jgi:hypothetical protein